MFERSKKATRAICVASVVVLGMSGAAEAALVSVDYRAAGDSLLTLDTVTGLRWLDVDATLGKSAHDLFDGAGGWVAAGFRYATDLDVRTLFVHAGLSSPDAWSPTEFAPAKALIDLLGDTRNRTDLDETVGTLFNGTGWKVGNVEAYPDFPTTVGSCSRGDSCGFFGTYTYSFVNVDYKASNVGNFLVLDVPEPSSLALLCLALAGVGAFRQRRFH